MQRFAPVLICFSLMSALTACAGPAAEIKLESPSPYQMQSLCFQLDDLTRVDVDCVAVRMKFSDQSFTGAWLVAVDSGREIWRSEPRKGSPAFDSRVIYKQSGRLDLPAGRYTLYQFGGGKWRVDAPFNNWGNVLNDLADMLNRERPDKNPDQYLGKCFVSMRQTDGRSVFRTTDAPRPSACTIDLRGMGDDQRETRTFKVERRTEVEIIGTGEWGDSYKHFYDFGWVEEAKIGEPVWVMDINRSKAAGGSDRNKISRRTLKLDPGFYTAGYVTDDSHAVGSWNAMPPSQPENWGLCIVATNPKRLKMIAIEDVQRPDVLVSMLRVGDDETRKAEFRLDDRSELHIRAMGEGRRNDMYDYGWIVDLDSGREVWSMTWDMCTHAGGTKRNLLFDREISLPAGRYQAIYTTDDSHSFEDWNSAAPRDAQRYGMVIIKR
jgi:hypothetical protein